mgnify:FL=1
MANHPFGEVSADSKYKERHPVRSMLSIVAVVIDNEKVTERFISSIRQYTAGKYELVLIDNASKNRSAISLVKKSADNSYRFHKRVSLSKAWNKGIKLAKGEYVAVVNNDTIVPPNWNNPLIETLKKNKKAGMVHPMTHNLTKGFFLYSNLQNFDKTFSKPFKLAKFKDIVWGEFMVFKKEALNKVGGFDEQYNIASGEDLEMNFQLYQNGYSIYVDPRVFVYHQGGASQVKRILSPKKRDRQWKENFELFKSHWPKYTKGWK